MGMFDHVICQLPGTECSEGHSLATEESYDPGEDRAVEAIAAWLESLNARPHLDREKCAMIIEFINSIAAAIRAGEWRSTK